MAWACDQAVRSEPRPGGRSWLEPIGPAHVDISEDGSVTVSYLSGETFHLTLESYGVPLDVRKRLQAEHGQGFPATVRNAGKHIAVECSDDTSLYLLPQSEETREGILDALRKAGGARRPGKLPE